MIASNSSKFGKMIKYKYYAEANVTDHKNTNQVRCSTACQKIE